MAEGIYSKLGTNVPYEVPTKCFYFLCGSESSMTDLASDWLKHFLLLKNGSRDLLQTWHKCSLQDPAQILFFCGSGIQYDHTCFWLADIQETDNYYFILF